jgi:hypothetical protein
MSNAVKITKRVTSESGLDFYKAYCHCLVGLTNKEADALACIFFFSWLASREAGGQYVGLVLNVDVRKEIYTLMGVSQFNYSQLFGRLENKKLIHYDHVTRVVTSKLYIPYSNVQLTYNIEINERSINN